MLARHDLLGIVQAGGGWGKRQVRRRADGSDGWGLTYKRSGLYRAAAAAPLEHATVDEVLAYPLDSRYRPDTEDSSLGRFLIIKQGYIETADFAPGRSLSVSGTLQRSQPGQIGEVTYNYLLATQYGGMPILEEISTVSADGVETNVIFTLGQLEPDPLDSESE